jgi:hypothetical protein
LSSIKPRIKIPQAPLALANWTSAYFPSQAGTAAASKPAFAPAADIDQPLIVASEMAASTSAFAVSGRRE